MELFGLRLFSKSSKFWNYLELSLVLLALIQYFLIKQKNEIYLILFILFGSFLLLNMMFVKKESTLKILIFFLGGIPILLWQYFNYDLNEPLIRFLSPLILILFSSLYIYNSNALFNKLWSQNFFNFKKDWLNITTPIFYLVLIFIPIAIVTTSLLHFLNAYGFFKLENSFSVDGFHQLLIGILLILFFLDHLIRVNNVNRLNNGRVATFNRKIKESARIFFHIWIIFFFFDTFLEVYRITNQGYISSENIFRELTNLGFLVLAIKSIFLTRWFSFIGLVSNKKARDSNFFKR